MGYRIEKNETVEQAIRRVTCEQIDKAWTELTDASLDRHEAVHQARKRFKKVRAVLRLARGSLDEVYALENVWFRDIARTLARVRDAGALIETVDGIRQTFAEQIEPDAFAAAREALVRRRGELAKESGDLSDRTADVAAQLRAIRGRVERWRLSAAGFDALEPGLRRTYRRGRKALGAAYEELTPEAFHEWRKRVKYHWYHVRLLREVWPGLMKARRRGVKDLADRLGDSHDLAVLQRTLRESPEEFGDTREVQALLGLVRRRQTELRAEARPLGRRIFAEKPKALSKRIARYWRAWADEPAPVLAVDAGEEATCS
mgnify:CR=1 FL=1